MLLPKSSESALARSLLTKFKVAAASESKYRNALLRQLDLFNTAATHAAATQHSPPRYNIEMVSLLPATSNADTRWNLYLALPGGDPG